MEVISQMWDKLTNKSLNLLKFHKWMHLIILKLYGSEQSDL